VIVRDRVPEAHVREHALHCTATRTSVPLRLRVLNGRGSIGCAELAAHGNTGPVFHEYETSMHGMPEAAAHASVDGGIGIAAHNDESTESCVAASRQLTLRTEYRAGYRRGWPILYFMHAMQEELSNHVQAAGASRCVCIRMRLCHEGTPSVLGFHQPARCGAG
jgi:hypothetical protein